MTCLSINSQLQQLSYDLDGNLLVTFRVSDSWSKKKVSQIEKEKELELKVKEYHSNRSIQQNRLMWELLTLLSKETHNDIDMLYTLALKKAKVKCDYIYVSDKVEEKVLRETFRSVERLRDIEHTNADGSKSTMICYRVYLGSSKFDTKEMNQLIDVVQQMCSEVGLCVGVNL